MVKLKDARHVIAAADFKTGHSWLLKQNLIGIGGLRTYIRIAPVSGAFKNCKLRPQQEPRAEAVLLGKERLAG